MSNLRTLYLANDILNRYNLTEDEYEVIETITFSDHNNMRLTPSTLEEAENNISFLEKTEKELVLVQKQYVNKVKWVFINFTMTGIIFFDENDNELFKTVGEGYADIDTPKAFFLN